MDNICDLTNNKTELLECKRMVRNFTELIKDGHYGQTVCTIIGYCGSYSIKAGKTLIGNENAQKEKGINLLYKSSRKIFVEPVGSVISELPI